jgi:hypothetical protein
MIAGGGDSEVDRGSSFVRNRPHDEYDTGSAETDNLQSTDQTDPIASTNSSGEAYLSIARFSKQALALVAVSASSLSAVGEDGLAIVDISKLTTVKVLENRRLNLTRGPRQDGRVRKCMIGSEERVEERD